MKLLLVHKYCGIIGGIERYIQQTCSLLKKHGYEFFGLFEEKLENASSFNSLFSKIIIPENETVNETIQQISSLDFDTILIHKITSIELLQKLQKKFSTIMFVHDHDYYCLRHHKYYPVSRKNCPYPFSFFRCALCSGLLRKNPESKIGISPVNIFGHAKLMNVVKSCSQFVVLSNFMQKNLEMNGFDKNKIKKIHPFIDFPILKDTTIKKKQTKLLYVGQIIRGKGVDLMIQALQYVRSDFSLTIAGHGDNTSYIKALISEKNLGSKIKMKGFVDDLGAEYRSADIVLVPSRWQEPFGLIGLETFSYETPVVAFDVGGISEWLQNKENGFLIKEGDLQSFAEKIDYLIENKNIAKDFGKNGRKMLEVEFSANKFLKDFNYMINKGNKNA